MRGTTVVRLPKTEMTLLCSRFQKSASDVWPVPGASLAMLKAWRVGMREPIRERPTRATKMAVSWIGGGKQSALIRF
jgi:hypothetical protein